MTSRFCQRSATLSLVKRQFLHEHHNRNEKAQQPDYRERFSSEGDEFERGGYEWGVLTMKDVLNAQAFCKKEGRYLKGKAAEILKRTLAASVLKVRGYRIRFNHTLETFAQANGLNPRDAARVFPEARRELLQRLEMTKKRLLQAELQFAEVDDPRTGQSTFKPTLCFGIFLEPETPIDWGRVWKRVLFRPIPQGVPSSKTSMPG